MSNLAYRPTFCQEDVIERSFRPHHGKGENQIQNLVQLRKLARVQYQLKEVGQRIVMESHYQSWQTDQFVVIGASQQLGGTVGDDPMRGCPGEPPVIACLRTPILIPLDNLERLNVGSRCDDLVTGRRTFEANHGS